MGLPGPVALQKNHHAILTPPHTWLPLCPKAYFPIRYGPEPGKGGTTVCSVVRGYGEMGGGGCRTACVENVRGEQGTHRSAQVDEGPDA